MIAPRSVISRQLCGDRYPAGWRSRWWFRRLDNSNMEKINQYTFYEFGRWIAKMQGFKEGASTVDVLVGTLNTLKAIRFFLADTSSVPLRLSKRSLEKVQAELEKWGNADLDFEKSIEEDELSLINEAINTFETIFHSEAQELEVFAIPQKLAYSTTTLVDHGEEVLPESIRNQVSDFTKNELRQAAGCIAFDLPTAAGFHLLRGLESSVRDYYDKVSKGAPRPTTKAGYDVAMGDYIVELEKLNVDKKVTETLRQIKRLHRDAQMHPDVTLEAGEDVILLGIVTSAIWAMFK